ncbi:hypothetical protein A8709_13290 [Paenibacillus pectinilyticus]|uniref:F5/8 type C domain-containing protein n=1 Tax=Paenibacillus pectinilyticus TaxID=512399 RepID=A0A1C1A3E0_9BACL|nr:family 43 glycosylhydrolase [Paenibacillus pectinilyticus]OCT15081.1 hypothetical protein A8709_13290 [Paenibacillus pectinilyticus]
MHDPSLIKVGSCYYGFSTGFEGGPGNGSITIRKTCDTTITTGWTYVGTIWNSVPAWITTRLGSTPPNIWAPDINYFNGQYYLYYGASIWGTNTATMGLATATNIEGPWTDQGEVTNVNYPIDPNVVWGPNNIPYITWGSWTGNGINMHVLDAATGKLSTTDNNLWHIGNGLENSTITSNNGYYYLLGSRGNCCSGVNSTYYTVVGRSTSITGPYLDENGVDLNSGGGTTILTGAGPEVAGGGADIFDDGSVKRLAYHYYDANNAGSETLNVRTLFFGNSARTGAADWINVSAPIYTPITGGTVTVSSSIENFGWLKSTVNDGQESSVSGAMGWSSSNSLTTNHTEWVQLDMGTNKSFSQVKLFPRTDGANKGYGFPIDFTIQLSTDGTNWTTVTTKTATPLPSGAQVYNFSATTARYVKINGTNLRTNPNDQNAYRMQFAEIETSGMNSGNLAVLKPVTASSSYEGSDWFTHRVNDGQKNAVYGSKGWSSNSSLTTNHTESIAIDTGAVQSISKVDLYPRNDSATQLGYGFPIDFTIKVSSDNVNWTTVVTRSAYALPGNSVQSFSFTSQSARYVKITGTNLRSNPNDNNAYRMQLAEIEIY